MRDTKGGDSVEVTGVVPGSPADKAGLMKGDLVISVDELAINDPREGKGISRSRALMAYVGNKHPDEWVSVVVHREGQEMALSARLTQRPTADIPMADHPEYSGAADAGPSLLETLLGGAETGTDYTEIVDVFKEWSSQPDNPFLSKSLFRSPQIQYVLQNPLRLPYLGRAIAGRVEGAWSADEGLFSSFLEEAALLEGFDAARSVPLNPNGIKNEPFQTVIVALVTSMLRAASTHETAFGRLQQVDRQMLEEWGHTVLADPGENEGDERDRSEEVLQTILELTANLDLASWFGSVRDVAYMAEKLGVLEDLPRTPPVTGWPVNWEVAGYDGEVLSLATPVGLVLIGGRGRNVYEEKASLIIDLGGDDVYRGCPAGASQVNPVSVVLDMSGNDRYDSVEDFCLGGGLLGAGILFDREGNDRYVGRDHSLGAAFVGVGLLYDASGDDSYECRSGCEGAAVLGVGGIADRNGNDSYQAALFAQGVAGVGGFGGLLDRAGNDTYTAGGLVPDHRAPYTSFQSFSQGFGMGIRPVNSLTGASGGIGILVDSAGNDAYIADYFGQGAAYWFSLGLLVDREGNDEYRSARYSQGAGVHFAGGMLLDEAGNDFYEASYGVAQGCGHDVAVGVLLDRKGRDRYVSGTLSQGAGSAGGIGMLGDLEGDDMYSAGEKSGGYGSFDPLRGYLSLGLFLDLNPERADKGQCSNSGTAVYRKGLGISLQSP